MFLCHQNDLGSEVTRMCAGWVGCHGGANLIALRIALRRGYISAATFRAAVEYTSPVPLFDSGAEAAAHGKANIENPSEDARRAVAKIVRNRDRISYE